MAEMTQERYDQLQYISGMLGEMAVNLMKQDDIEQALEWIERSETVGTLFMAPVPFQIASQRVAAYGSLLKAIQGLREEYERFSKVVSETQPTLERLKQARLTHTQAPK